MQEDLEHLVDHWVQVLPRDALSLILISIALVHVLLDQCACEC
jgi:hypothetical protein